MGVWKLSENRIGHNCSRINYSTLWYIKFKGADPGFPRGHQPSSGDANIYFLPNFPKNCIKLRKFWFIGEHVMGVPPWICHWSTCWKYAGDMMGGTWWICAPPPPAKGSKLIHFHADFSKTKKQNNRLAHPLWKSAPQGKSWICHWYGLHINQIWAFLGWVPLWQGQSEQV